MIEDKELGCIVCRHVAEHKRFVRYVEHSYDGMWQFTCGEPDHHGADDGLWIGFNHIAEKDGSLDLIKSIPKGSYAERSQLDDEWVVNKSPCDT